MQSLTNIRCSSKVAGRNKSKAIWITGILTANVLSVSQTIQFLQISTNNLQGQLENLKAFGPRQEIRRNFASRNWGTVSHMYATYLWANKHYPTLIFPCRRMEDISANEIIAEIMMRLLKKPRERYGREKFITRKGKKIGLVSKLVWSMQWLRSRSIPSSLSERSYISISLMFVHSASH